jgi:hypothetical protein
MAAPTVTADEIAVIETASPATQIRAHLTTYAGGAKYLTLSEFTATRSRRRGRRPNATPTSFAPTPRVLLLPIERIPELRAALDSADARLKGGDHG